MLTKKEQKIQSRIGLSSNKLYQIQLEIEEFLKESNIKDFCEQKLKANVIKKECEKEISQLESLVAEIDHNDEMYKDSLLAQQNIQLLKNQILLVQGMETAYKKAEKVTKTVNTVMSEAEKENIKLRLKT